MKRDDVKQMAVNAVVDVAKLEAETLLKAVDVSDVEHLINAQIDGLVEPLEKEIQTTGSWWVKVRNKLYIALLRQSAQQIVTDVKKKIQG